MKLQTWGHLHIALPWGISPHKQLLDCLMVLLAIHTVRLTLTQAFRVIWGLLVVRSKGEGR
jgi:hypothetical protein